MIVQPKLLAEFEAELCAELVRIDMESEGGLGGTSEGVYGPLACALVGYYPVEIDRFRAFMNDMEADMVKVSAQRCFPP